MILKVSEHTSDVLMAHHKFRLYAYLGDSHYFLGSYKQAEHSYKAALTFKEACCTAKTPLKQFDNSKEAMPDIGIIFFFLGIKIIIF